MQKHRYYKDQYPNIGDIVVVKIQEIDTDMAIVKAELLEYGGLMGTMSFSEISRKRIRSLRDHVKINQVDYLEVLRIEEFVELSKKNVQPRDIMACRERFTQAKQVDTILRKIAITHSLPISEVYSTIVWPLSDSKYKNAYTAFIAMSQGVNCLSIPEPLNTTLISNIKNKFTPSDYTIRAQIDVRCHFSGITGLKSAFNEGMKLDSPQNRVQIKVLSAPIYLISVISIVSETSGRQTMDSVINTIRDTLKVYGGTLEIKLEPYLASGNTSIIEDMVIVDDNKDNQDVDEDIDEEEEDE